MRTHSIILLCLVCFGSGVGTAVLLSEQKWSDRNETIRARTHTLSVQEENLREEFKKLQADRKAHEENHRQIQEELLDNNRRLERQLDTLALGFRFLRALRGESSTTKQEP